MLTTNGAFATRTVWHWENSDVPFGPVTVAVICVPAASTGVTLVLNDALPSAFVSTGTVARSVAPSPWKLSSQLELWKSSISNGRARDGVQRAGDRGVARARGGERHDGEVLKQVRSGVRVATVVRRDAALPVDDELDPEPRVVADGIHEEGVGGRFPAELVHQDPGVRVPDDRVRAHQVAGGVGDRDADASLSYIVPCVVDADPVARDELHAGRRGRRAADDDAAAEISADEVLVDGVRARVFTMRTP